MSTAVSQPTRTQNRSTRLGRGLPRRDQGLRRRRREVMALRGVDLDVYGGQLTLLVGPSGCGKTTLISIIAGLLDPTAGDVDVLGCDLRLRAADGEVPRRQTSASFSSSTTCCRR